MFLPRFFLSLARSATYTCTVFPSLLRRRTIYTLPTQSLGDNGSTYCCEVEVDLYLRYRQYWYHRDNTNHRRFFDRTKTRQERKKERKIPSVGQRLLRQFSHQGNSSRFFSCGRAWIEMSMDVSKVSGEGNFFLCFCPCFDGLLIGGSS